MRRISMFVLVLAAASLSVAAEGANLLTNGNFAAKDGGSEQNAADWMESGAASRETWSGRTEGQYGMAMRCWEGGGVGEAYQEVKAKAGTEYTFKIWACRDNGTLDGEFYIKLAWYSGKELVSEDVQKASLTAEWAQFVISAKAPPKADKVRVAFGSTNVTMTGKFTEAELTGK